MRLCTVSGCSRLHRARGLCAVHYGRKRRQAARVPLPRVDLTGFRYSDLRVTGWDDRRGRWSCLCDCGRSRLVATGGLTGGRVRSCGHHHARTPEPDP